MSYSLSVRAANKAEAKAAVGVELDKVVASQPIHARDRAQAEAAAHAFIDQLADDDSRDVCVNVSGSLGWSGTLGQDGNGITSASVGVSAYLTQAAG